MKINEANIVKHLHLFTPIYEAGKQVNPVPQNTPVIVYCSNGKDVTGWKSVKCVNLKRGFFSPLIWLS